MPILAAILAYALRSLLVTVLYHRGLTHGGLALGPGLTRAVERAGVWLTGSDPRAWVCLDRMHHAAADRGDRVGPIAALLERRSRYRAVLAGLAAGERAVTRHVADLRLRRGMRPELADLPHVAAALVAVTIALAGAPAVATGLAVGLFLHHLVASEADRVGHRRGRRRFATRTVTRNLRWLAPLSFGESLQNNHHRFPQSARFGLGRAEIDPGYLACRLLDRLGLATIVRGDLLSTSAARVPLAADRAEVAPLPAETAAPRPARRLRFTDHGWTSRSRVETPPASDRAIARRLTELIQRFHQRALVARAHDAGDLDAVLQDDEGRPQLDAVRAA